MYGMIASGAGTVMQGIAQYLAQQEMKKTFEREMLNQNRYRNQAFGTFEQALPKQGVEQAQVDLGAGQDRRQQAYGSIGQTQLGLGEQRTAIGNKQAELQGNSRAKLGAYSDWKLNSTIRQIRLQDELNKISSFSSGDAGVFPGLMQDAQHSQDKLAMWGQMLQSLGGGAGAFMGGGGGGGNVGFSGVNGQGRGFGAPQNFGQQYKGYA